MNEIGELFHIIHVSEDLIELDDWYTRVFGAQRFMEPSYSEAMQRDATLTLIGADFVAEPMSPPGGENESPLQETMLGRFQARHGRHLHSIAWYVTDEGPLWDRLTASGVRVNGGTGTPQTGRPPLVSTGGIFAHPKDAHCQLEFMAVGDAGYMATDPRKAADFSAKFWTDEHPLGIQRTSHLTVVVRDLEKASKLYEEALGGRKFHTATSAENGTESAFFAVGPGPAVELAMPVGPGLAQDDLKQHGEIMHAVSFRVRDLAAAEAHMRKHAISVRDRTDQTITLEPDDTYGAIFRLTTADTPDDPRA